MTKKHEYIILTLFLLIGQFCSQAQEFEAWLNPSPGDSIFSLTDNLPIGIEVGPPGQNQVWDFTSLQSPFVRKYSFSQSQDDLISVQKSGIEFQYLKREESIYLSSILNIDVLRMGIPITLRCSPALLEYKNPIKYYDASSEYSRFIGYIPWNLVPRKYKIDGVDLQDSLRIVLEVNRDDAVDASGDLLMQNEVFEVVRMRRIEEQLLRVYARNMSEEWIDITPDMNTLLSGIAWNSISYSYLYLTANMPGPVAEVYTDENDNVERVIFSADPKMAKEISPNERLRGVYLYPNPTLGDVRFEFFNLPEGNYELSVLNILGKKLWASEEKITNEKVILADLSFLRRGTYAYSLVDEKGKRVATHRLIIIKP